MERNTVKYAKHVHNTTMGMCHHWLIVSSLLPASENLEKF